MVTLSKLRNLKAKYQHGLATLAMTERDSRDVCEFMN